MNLIVLRPLAKDEILPKQSYKKSLKNANLIISQNDNNKDNHTNSDDGGLSNLAMKEKKSSKSHKKNSSNEKKDKIKETKDREYKKKIKLEQATGEPVDLLGTPMKKVSSSSLHNKKGKKEKKSSKVKKLKMESKSGYEEALGISTPSKEIY